VSETNSVTAGSYARWRASSLGRITERIDTDVILALAGTLKGKRVLDLGTGDGTYAIEAAARGAIVTALDPQQEMLDATQRRARQRGLSVRLLRGRIESLPIEDRSFDVVIAVTVLCFVPEVRAAMREVVRVLAPAGRLVIGELGRCSVWAAERRVRGWLGAKTWRNIRFWSRRELVDLVESAGLRLDAVRGSVFYLPSGVAARVFAPIEPLLTRLRAPGAAFLAVAADRPEVKS
jgi:ubiquinone/menaquinone biosynthesis C-methylase UbiE